jgi:hypothetical protein
MITSKFPGVPMTPSRLGHACQRGVAEEQTFCAALH